MTLSSGPFICQEDTKNLGLKHLKALNFTVQKGRS